MLLPYLAAVLLLVATVYAGIVSFREPREGSPGNWLFPNAAKRSAKITVAIASLIFVAGVGFLLLNGSRHGMRESTRFLIPDGYTGWVRVEFEVKGAPPLPSEDGERVVTIPANGQVSTSSQEQYGWTNDAYFYVSAEGPAHKLPSSGADSRIWGKINGEATNASGRHKYEEFFVGSAQQFKDQANEAQKATH